jgi:hypothetical protein
MPELSEVTKLGTWRVRGRTWSREPDGDAIGHEVIIATRGKAEDAHALGRAALASQAPRGPGRVVVDEVIAEEPIWVWELGGEL